MGRLMFSAFGFIVLAAVIGLGIGYFVGYRQAKRGLPEVPPSPRL